MTLSYAEFQEWGLYYQIEPWGEDRADLRAGIVASTIANYAGKVRAEGADPALPADFMPYLDQPEPEAPADDRPLADAVAADLSRRLFGAVGTPTSGGWLSSLLGRGSPTMAGAGSAAENWIDSGGLAKSAGGLLSGIGGFFSNLFSFDVGTDYVPRDMLAKVHQGERIVPASQNTGSNSQTIQITVHVNGNSNAPDVRRAAGQGAREAMAALIGAQRYV